MNTTILSGRRIGRILGVLTIICGAASSVGALTYLDQKPLAEEVNASAQPWTGSSTNIKVPLIAWGGDIQTILANGGAKRTQSGSVFAKQGLQLDLYREDVFSKQVESYLKGETPFLRGTMGMLNMASELTESQPFTEMVVIYQLTWSAGGDALVVKDSIQRPIDLKGKTIALQAYGPHVDYLTTVLASVGLSTNDVTLKWMPDLFEVDASSSSPAMALLEDGSVDAAMAIIPDALALTSGGNVGTGAEGSVKGAEILLSTKTADKVIADVYAVRKDFYQKYPGVVEKFVAGLAEAEEELNKLAQAKGSAWNQIVSQSAGILLDDTGATEDMNGMFLDARFVGLGGNQKFFANPSNPRRFEALNTEIQSAFVSMGLLKGTSDIAKARFDYDGIRRDKGVTVRSEAPRFDQAAVSAVVNRRTQMDSLEEGELYAFEIYFRPNQNSFSSDLYQGEFDKVIELVSIYGGALLTIEGHSDPTSYLRSKKNNSPSIVLSRVKQSAKNLSFSRANAVKDSLMGYASGVGITLDASQFGVVGHGVMKPNTSGASFDPDGDIALSSAPRTREEWEATRRVVFRLIQIEAEADVFEPLF
ncbi:MAG: ABC transporter substrate-binding protein [Verrucomicrobiota bacterium]